MDIEELTIEFARDPVLGPAAGYLKGYQELIDSISDGWPYWSYGTRCASDLSELLKKAHDQKYAHWNDPEFKPTRADVEKAVKPIARFIRGKKMQEAIGYARDFRKREVTLPVLETAVQLSLL
jgi:hypothetical protein